MKKYKEIHIWEFPPTITFIGLNDTFKIEFFKRLKQKIGSREEVLRYINQSSKKYGLNRKYNSGHLSFWKIGKKKDKDKIRTINIPLWLLIETSKVISENKKIDNKIMKEMEKNIQFYTGTGKSHNIRNPKLPLHLTPEMTSIIFHFLGDGHIGKKEEVSSYRQMNKLGLNNFLNKLNNIFGDFNYPLSEFANGRLNIPKIITEFYNYFFKLPSTNTFDSYVSDNIKNLNKEFLVGGLASFIIDEGHVGEVITIYSKNKRLIGDIREISMKCGYLSHPIREKYAYGKFEVYRFSISSKSYKKFYSDLIELSKKFPKCDLGHKMDKFTKRIHSNPFVSIPS